MPNLKPNSVRVLLDTNIIIHREGANVVRDNIGSLFNQLDKQAYKKCIHPLTIGEIKKHQNAQVVNTMSIKMESYHHLQTIAPLDTAVKAIGDAMDTTDNDRIDTHLINEVFLGRVDYLISEDKKIHVKAAKLGISSKVFRIVTFLTKALAEDVSLVDYEVLSVKQRHFGVVDLSDPFFETFRADYPGFDKWFNGKCDELAYVSLLDGVVAAFLYLKTEDVAEDYSNVSPMFTKKKRLKIGTFKVASNGIRLGERFLKIIFDNARAQKVDEIYVTIFNTRPELMQLIGLLEEWGFVHHGVKTSAAGTEQVYVRPFGHAFNADRPKTTYPILGAKNREKVNRVFIVPIYPEYHTKLFPDSMLKTERKKEWDDTQPYRHSISKSYVCRSITRDLKSGDIIVFYRTGDTLPKWHTSTATTIGIVESVHDNLHSLEELKAVCRKRTVLTDEELKEWWDYNPRNRPFVVNFLYAYSFKTRPNLRVLVDELKVFSGPDDVPRGFREIGWDNLRKLATFGGI